MILKNYDLVKIFKPHSLRELQLFLKENPGLYPLAGATDFMRRIKQGELLELPSAIVSLEEIEELKKIKRRENSLEIGACVSLAKLISLGKPLIPELLLEVLKLIATPSVRNLATVGGALMQSPPASDLVLPLILLDAKVEVRNFQSHLWVPITKFIKEQARPNLAQAEIISAVNLPIIAWTYWLYHKLPLLRQPEFSIGKICASVLIIRDNIADFRLALAGVDPIYWRSREFEAKLIGLKIPFSVKKINQLKEDLLAHLEDQPASFLPDRYHKNSLMRLALDFIKKISNWSGASIL